MDAEVRFAIVAFCVLAGAANLMVLPGMVADAWRNRNNCKTCGDVAPFCPEGGGP